MSTPTPLHVLILEDQPADAELMLDELRQAGFEPNWRRVETEAEYRAQLDPAPEIILADYHLPQWDAPRALHSLQEHGLEIPFIIVSGTVGEEQAVACIKQGAADYLLKDRLARLGPAVRKALEDKRLRMENQQAEAAMRTSETRYRRLFEAAQDGILILDAATGQIVDVNPFLIALLGYSHTEFLDKKLWELGLFRDVAASEAAFRHLVETGYVRYEGLPLETKDGRRIEVEFVSNVYQADAQTVIQCNIRDITERKQTEKKLRSSEQQYRQLIENLHSAVVVHAPDTRILLHNRSASELLGLSDDELMGKTAVDPAWNFVGEDGVTMPVEAYPVNRVLVSHKPLVNLQLGINRPHTASILWVLVNAFPAFDDRQQIKQVVVTFIDITERKRAEDELRKLQRAVEQSASTVVITDLQGNIDYVNPRFTQVTGYTAAEVIGKNPGFCNRARRRSTSIVNCGERSWPETSGAVNCTIEKRAANFTGNGPRSRRSATPKARSPTFWR